MKRFKNILVVPATASADDRALERAVRLAQNNAARLTVALCVEEATEGEWGVELQRGIVAGSQQRLDQIVEPARDQGLLIETRVLVGRPFLELIKQVLRDGHDLVMKTAQGTSRAKLLLFGSTDMHLMRKCPCPVWMIGSERSERTGGVLAAVDPESTNDEKQALNTTIMELATSLALLEEVGLHVVHAWDAPYEDTLRHSPFLQVSRAEVDRQLAEIPRRHQKGLDDLVARFEKVAPDMNVHLVKGAPWETIPALAEENGIEVIVMGTVCRTGLPGFFMGNTAEELLNRVDCSVLAIKPKGFVSPVTLATT